MCPRGGNHDWFYPAGPTKFCRKCDTIVMRLTEPDRMKGNLK